MEIRESLLTEYLSAKAKEPYSLMHALLHRMRRFGKIVEKENTIAASGPRTTARMHFTIERAVDRFTKLFIDVCLEGDEELGTIEMNFHSSVASHAPEPKGLLTGIFLHSYETRILDRMQRFAEQLAKDAFMEARATLLGEKEFS